MLSNSSLVEKPAPNISIEQEQSNNNDLKESLIADLNVQMFPELSDFRKKASKKFDICPLEHINCFHTKFTEVHEIVTLNFG